MPYPNWTCALDTRHSILRPYCSESGNSYFSLLRLITSSFNSLFLKNVRAICSYQNDSVNCTEILKPGTQLEYSCLPHYIPLDVKPQRKSTKDEGGIIICASDGSWTNYPDFQSFRCKEGKSSVLD